MASRSLSDLGGLVYSTDVGSTCTSCRRAVGACICAASRRPVGDGVVRVSCETKGRAGKGVTLVRGLLLDDVALAELGKQLKSTCGSGGTVKNGVIEVQGDHRERIISLLQGRGHTVKRAGG